MAGAGLPLDEALARQSHQKVAKARALVWEFSADHGRHATPFVYEKKLALLQKLIDDYSSAPAGGCAAGPELQRLLHGEWVGDGHLGVASANSRSASS